MPRRCVSVALESGSFETRANRSSKEGLKGVDGSSSNHVRGGDALDAVLAAVSAYHHAARLGAEKHADVRRNADLLEGHIFAGSQPGA